MAQRPFGNRGTVAKLKTIFYTSALKDQPFRLHYLDAFAGSGEVPVKNDIPLLEGVVDADAVILGSARRALEVSIPFDSYLFSDLKQQNTKALLDLKVDFPHLADRIRVAHGNANDVVADFCAHLGPRDRALVFLDPFGNHVTWATLEALANTRKVDLWYLFPAWIGVARQVRNSGSLLKDAEASIDAMFGLHDWRSASLQVTKPLQTDLFADASEQTKKIASADSITRFMISCMETIFGGGVSKAWLPLGRGGRTYYSLLFACANPGEKAKKLAQRVANDIMKRK
jgi:three-Cys-motif partner protein